MKDETKLLLEALANVRGEPTDKVLHNAVIAYFAQTGRDLYRSSEDSRVSVSSPRKESLPDRIRRHVLKKHIEPARQRGEAIRRRFGAAGSQQRARPVAEICNRHGCP
jgi:hypothetical protein